MEKDALHNYEYRVDLDGNSAPARVVRMVGNNKRVLEIGAGPGSITRHLHGSGNCSVIALEIDDEAIPLLKPFCERVYQADLNDPKWPDLLNADGKFDVVVAADVLEHVYDPWKTLKLISSLVGKDGSVVISLPHVGHSAVAACLLAEDFHYRDWGLLDRTHIRFFGLKNMQSLFNDAGLSIVEAQFVIVSPEDSELSGYWNSLGSNVRKALSSHKYGNVYQVVIKAVPANSSVNSLDLLAIPVEMPVYSGTTLIKRIAKKFIPENQRGKAKAIARMFGVKG